MWSLRGLEMHWLLAGWFVQLAIVQGLGVADFLSILACGSNSITDKCYPIWVDFYRARNGGTHVHFNLHGTHVHRVTMAVAVMRLGDRFYCNLFCFIIIKIHFFPIRVMLNLRNFDKNYSAI